MAKKFKWRDGARLKSDPTAVGKELEKIRKKGDLTAEAVVDAARDESSPMHDDFEWDDSKAAHEYRLVTARTLIRSIEVIIENGGQSKQQYVHVQIDQPTSEEKRSRVGKYETMAVVVSRVDYYQQALEELEGKLSAAARAVRDLKEAAGKSKHRAKLAVIGIVTKALETAISAVKKLSA